MNQSGLKQNHKNCSRTQENFFVRKLNFNIEGTRFKIKCQKSKSSVRHTGFLLVNVITWPGYWPLIGWEDLDLAPGLNDGWPGCNWYHSTCLFSYSSCSFVLGSPLHVLQAFKRTHNDFRYRSHWPALSWPIRDQYLINQRPLTSYNQKKYRNKYAW